MHFRDILNRTPEQKKLGEYRMRRNLADLAVRSAKEDGTSANSDLYSALSHLAAVPELEINIAMYDDLQYTPEGTPFNQDAYLLIRQKRKQLDDLIVDMEMKEGVKYAES